MPKRYTITAALPYTNGPIHIGHLAGVYVPADIYSRYLRGQGKDVAFICGSDEHGVAIALKAKKEGRHRVKLLIIMTNLFGLPLRNLVFPLIIIHGLLEKSIMKLPKNFSKFLTIKEFLKKKIQSNYLIPRLNSFWQTDL